MSRKTTAPKSEKKHWYAATLLIRMRIEDYTGPYSCNEQVRLISARSPEKAYAKAYKLGKAQETCYLNESGAMVYLELVGLTDLTLVDSALKDGVEIKSRQFKHSAPHILALMQDELPIFGGPSLGQWHLIAEAEENRSPLEIDNT